MGNGRCIRVNKYKSDSPCFNCEKSGTVHERCEKYLKIDIEYREKFEKIRSDRVKTKASKFDAMMKK